MKRSLLILMGLLSSVSPSFAMLDDPLVETEDCYTQYGWGSVKELRPKGTDFRSHDPRYEGRSAIYGSKYPKMVMIHPYNHSIHNTPFAAALSHARAPKLLEDYYAQHLSSYEKVYSFVVQPIQADQTDSALKPHYFAHPDAPTTYAGKDYPTNVHWTVIPGAQGQIEPLKGSLQSIKQLLHDFLNTHDSLQPDRRMGVSDSILSLKGFKKIQGYTVTGFLDECILSADLYSFVAFEDEGGKKIVSITYHWLLNPGFYDQQYCDTRAFKKAVKKATTFRQLITNLEPLDNFKSLLGELKQYVGLSPRIDRIEADLQPTHHAANIETTPERITVITDHNANASYQLESNRLAVMVGQNIRVPYEITVEEGGKMAFGLLNTNKNGWYGEELVLQAGHHQGFYDRMVPEGEIETSLVFRNYHLGTPGQTTFTINHPIVEIDGRAEKVQINPTMNPVNVSHKKLTKVTTDNNANASYQLESDRFSVIPDEKIRVSYEITVEPGGIMSLGLLNTLRAGWYGDEVVLGPGQHANFFERIVPQGEAQTSLVFRNYHLGTPGQTTFTIESLKIEKEGKASLL